MFFEQLDVGQGRDDTAEEDKAVPRRPPGRPKGSRDTRPRRRKADSFPGSWTAVGLNAAAAAAASAEQAIGEVEGGGFVGRWGAPAGSDPQVFGSSARLAETSSRGPSASILQARFLPVSDTAHPTGSMSWTGDSPAGREQLPGPAPTVATVSCSPSQAATAAGQETFAHPPVFDVPSKRQRPGRGHAVAVDDAGGGWAGGGGFGRIPAAADRESRTRAEGQAELDTMSRGLSSGQPSSGPHRTESALPLLALATSSIRSEQRMAAAASEGAAPVSFPPQLPPPPSLSEESQAAAQPVTSLPTAAAVTPGCAEGPGGDIAAAVAGAEQLAENCRDEGGDGSGVGGGGAGSGGGGAKDSNDPFHDDWRYW